MVKLERYDKTEYTPVTAARSAYFNNKLKGGFIEVRNYGSKLVAYHRKSDGINSKTVLIVSVDSLEPESGIY